eukprot:jgi/Mesvir1/3855/Mv19819-RA.1
MSRWFGPEEALDPHYIASPPTPPDQQADSVNVMPALLRGCLGSEMGTDLDEKAIQLLKLLKAYSTAKKMREDANPDKVVERLYLGSIGSYYNRAALRQLSITHILSVMVDVPKDAPEGIVTKNIPVTDAVTTDIASKFLDSYRFISAAIEQGGTVLVHCFAGRSRSVTVVISYLMAAHDMSLDEALAIVTKARPVACPNPGFLLQLKKLEGRRQQGGKGVHLFEPDVICNLPPHTPTVFSSQLASKSEMGDL